MSSSQQTKIRHKISKRETGILRRLFQLNSVAYQRSSQTDKSVPSGNQINNTLNSISRLSQNEIERPENNISLIKKPEKIEEKTIDFKTYKNKTISPLLKLGCRFINNELQLSFIDKIISIVKIQSVFRSYMFKKHFNLQIEEEIERKGIEEIILLQSLIRQYLVGIKIRKNFLRDEIVDERDACADKILSLFQLMSDKNQVGINALKLNILKCREEAAQKIQHIYRGYKYYSKFKKLRNEMTETYFITYPFFAKKVELRVFLPGSSTSINIGIFNNSFKQFPFVYNEFLGIFILSIPPSTFPSGQYRCQFIIDGFASCDGRFPNVEFEDGTLYNMVGFFVDKKSIPDNYDDFGNSQEPPDMESSNSGKSEDLLENLKNLRESGKQNYDLDAELYGRRCEDRMDEMRKRSFSNFHIDY